MHFTVLIFLAFPSLVLAVDVVVLGGLHLCLLGHAVDHQVDLKRKIMSWSQGQELGQLADLASDWLFTLVQCSQSGASLLVDTTLDNSLFSIPGRCAGRPSRVAGESCRTARWQRTWGGNLWVVIIVKSWVNLLTWLLIGCSTLCNQWGAMGKLFDLTLDFD